MSASAPQSVINWTPAGGSNSVNQTVQYKATTSATWISFGTVAAGIATATITGLVNNTKYDFQILDNCSVGGPTASIAAHGLQFACPTVTLTPTYNSVQFDFTLTGIGDITKIDVQLLTSDNTTVAGTQTITGPTNSAYTKTFTGLSASTTYYGRLIQYADTSYTGNCASQSTTTAVTPACIAPTNVTATLS